MVQTTTLVASLLFLSNLPPADSLRLPREVTSTNKAGLGWPNGNTVDIKQFESGKVSWYYTWSSFSTTSSLEFVPMLWGQSSLGAFEGSVNQTVAEGGVKAVLGMNEPDQTGQANLSPGAGATMWKTYLEPLKKQGVRLGSPATSSAPAGKVWVQNFITACSGGCTIDFIALHWYGTNATQFISYIQDFHNTFNLPIWVTEWACQNYVQTNEQCSQEDVVQFLNETQGFMDATPWVERYAWFGAMKNMQGVNQDNALMDSNGKIIALGEQYIGAEAPQSSGSGSAVGPTATGSSSGVTALISSTAGVVSAVMLVSMLVSYTP